MSVPNLNLMKVRIFAEVRRVQDSNYLEVVELSDWIKFPKGAKPTAIRLALDRSKEGLAEDTQPAPLPRHD